MIIKVDRKKIEASIKRQYEVLAIQKGEVNKCLELDDMASAMNAMNEVISADAWIDALKSVLEGAFNEDCECGKR